MATGIKELWAENKEVRESKEVDLAYRSLQANAETTILQLQSDELVAEKALETARRGSKSSPNFQNIVDAVVNLKVARALTEEARSVYSDEFGEDAKL